MIGLEMLDPIRDKLYQLISIAEGKRREEVNKYLENLNEKEVRLLRSLMAVGRDETVESVDKKGADNLFAYYFTTSGDKNKAVFEMVQQAEFLAGYLRSSIDKLGLYEGIKA